jgi:DNA processing protein
LSIATIVVEAGSRSGALITAATATEQGKQVFAVPGNVDNEMSIGCNELIKTGGAALLTSFEDVLSSTDFLPGFSLKEESAPLQREEFDDDSILNETDRKILDYLRKGDAQFDSISANTGISAGELSRKLVALEISHRIERQANGSYRRLR